MKSGREGWISGPMAVCHCGCVVRLGGLLYGGPLDIVHLAAFSLGQPMYLLYRDDSGSPGNKSESHLILGGVAVFERRTYFLSRELDELAERWAPGFGASVELHAREIFSGKIKPWSDMDRDKRRQSIKDVVNVLAADRYRSTAFAVAVHKDSYPGRDPMEVAFEEVCRRFDLWLTVSNSVERPDDPHRGTIVLDRTTYETTLQNLARDFRSLGTRWGVIRNLAEVPFFVDSKACRIVQLADHIAYSTFRAYEYSDYSYLNPILSKFHQDQNSGKLHGLVHLQNQNPRCMCHACLSRRVAEAKPAE